MSETILVERFARHERGYVNAKMKMSVFQKPCMIISSQGLDSHIRKKAMYMLMLESIIIFTWED